MAATLNTLRSGVLKLAHQVLSGGISLEDLHAQWPIDAPREPFLAQVLRDLESALEHAPQDWANTAAEVDLALLQNSQIEDGSVLLKARAAILAREPRSEDDIYRWVDDFLRRNPR